MHFLLQKNIWGEYGYDRFVDSVIRAGISYQMVNSIPFTEEFDEEITHEPDHCFGSTRFINVCRKKGMKVFPTFYPGAFEMFPKEHWINGDGYVSKWGELDITRPVFIKPFTEKFFTGKVVEQNSDLEQIQLSTSFIEDEKEELIMVSECVNIKTEVRFFVLNGGVITGSGYRSDGNAHHFKISCLHPSWGAAEAILKSVIKGDVDAGFTLDLGLVEGEWKIVELNNLNSAGFYESDTDALVRAIAHS